MSWQPFSRLVRSWERDTHGDHGRADEPVPLVQTLTVGVGAGETDQDGPGGRPHHRDPDATAADASGAR